MNTIAVTKGKNIKLFANNTRLGCVTKLEVEQNNNAYKIQEFLAESEFDIVNVKKSYTIVITALSDINDDTLESDNFTLDVIIENKTYVYTSCNIISKSQTSDSSNYISYKYTISAKSLTISGGDISG